jgi:hypothetical protein
MKKKKKKNERGEEDVQNRVHCSSMDEASKELLIKHEVQMDLLGSRIPVVQNKTLLDQPLFSYEVTEFHF